MDKDIKKILIMWIISVIISAIWLYNFKDIKFKNTKNLEKKENEAIENMINEYNDIVDVYIPNITDKKEEDIGLPSTWDLSLLIPWFLDNSWFQTITEDLKSDDIFLTITKFDKINELKSSIINWIWEYDIYLLPTNRIAWLNTQDIDIWENLQPYFINIFSGYLSNTWNKFIPFAIDPAIMLYKKWIQEQKSRNSLFTYITLWEQVKPYTMPLIRWVGNIDLKLIENGNEPFENYFELLYLQLKQLKDNKQYNELSTMIDIENIYLDHRYNYANFKSLNNILKKNNSNCEKFPWICAIVYKFWDIKPWYLSDLDIIDTYLWGLKDNIDIKSFINSDKSYPIKWRVFIVPNWNDNTKLSNKFFEYYISKSVEWDPSFWDNTLSAINTIYEQQKWKYPEITNKENIFRLFYNNLNLQEKIVNDGKTINALKWDYNTELYLKNIEL